MATSMMVSRAVVVLVISIHCYAQAHEADPSTDLVTPDNEPKSAVRSLEAHITERSAGEPSAVDLGTKVAVDASEGDISDSKQIESESRGHGIKIKKKKPKLKKGKKFLKKFLPFLLIPLLIQAKLIPLFLFKLKLIALKAFGVGKLALILIAINVIYTLLHGAHDGDQQYSKEVLASEHYGYNGGPEYGAWVNRRLFNLPKP